MRFAKVLTIAAPADVVWDVVTDVESWPDLTPSMTWLRREGSGGLAVGTQVWIKQPRLPQLEWTVTEVVDGQRFVWEAVSPGMRTRAAHTLLEVAGETTLRLEIEQHGPLSGVVGALTGPMTRKYLEWEGRGIKRRAESLA